MPIIVTEQKVAAFTLTCDSCRITVSKTLTNQNAAVEDARNQGASVLYIETRSEPYIFCERCFAELSMLIRKPQTSG